MKTLRDFQAQKINKLMMSMLKGGASCASGQTLFTCTITMYDSSYSGYACAANFGEAMINVGNTLFEQLGLEEEFAQTEYMCNQTDSEYIGEFA
ncbi:hypothetical protein M2451_004134 [Dysgonomonas sp. PFB1-18]|uniref:hypothetical protein n=1 Tax=unclassified Dysgonomonas TaxID=2630389 RepID=UPI0024771334|nr:MULTISPECIES: hypothetical protein [unclassified Dysgonomonas]MDH6311199.1 hypothetical protein [Dysgonomonas sp. PF1-14]MDH6341083.1 hypothetical protein [Dysgonomonas sp. PF1-16]MDH6382783.1 hypothetical protein [Dysgonomonas sp. PFB1-18]MDH6400071.1 hypothetical protein [Dysgonomonas sp. PF1-23]